MGDVNSNKEAGWLKRQLSKFNKTHIDILMASTVYALQMLGLVVPNPAVGVAAPTFGWFSGILRTKGYFDSDLDEKQKEELEKIIKETFKEVTNNSAELNNSKEALSKLTATLSVENLFTTQSETEIENILSNIACGKMVNYFLENMTQKVKKAPLLCGTYNATQIDIINSMLQDYTQILQEHGEKMQILEQTQQEQGQRQKKQSEMLDEHDKKLQTLTETNFLNTHRSFKCSHTQEVKIVKSVFVSYNWAQENFADKLENEIAPYVKVIRDKNTLGARDSLTEFMKRIRSEDFVVLLISDEYLKSINCMYEVSQLVKDNNWYSKVFFVVFDNATKIYNVVTQGEYLTYWNDKRKEIELSIASPLESRSREVEALQKINDILIQIGDFLKKVNDNLNPKPDEAINEILRWIKNLSSIAEPPKQSC